MLSDLWSPTDKCLLSKDGSEIRIPAVTIPYSYWPSTGCWRHPQPRVEVEFSGLIGPDLMTSMLKMVWLSSPISSDRGKSRPA